MGASMWDGLVGVLQIVTGQGNGAVALPSGALILLGWNFHTSTNTATCAIACSDPKIGTITVPLPTLQWEKHFNHTLYTPITGITIANFGVNDVWWFEFVRRGHV